MLIDGAESIVADPLVFLSAARAQHSDHGSLPSEHFCLPFRDYRWMRRIHPIQIEVRTGYELRYKVSLCGRVEQLLYGNGW